jgi:murein DD-endopeptidase MepM/ murein hydrolase activator NlpD
VDLSSLYSLKAPRQRAHALARNQRRPVLHGLLLGLIAVGVLSSVFVSQAFPFESSEPSFSISGLSLPSVEVAQPVDAVITASAMPDTVSRAEFEGQLARLSGGSDLQVQAEQPKPASQEVEPPPLFIRYTVRPGDTVSGIAAQFGVEVRYLLWNNTGLSDADALSVGEVLYIPGGNGILHYVSLGETVSGIASYYGVTVDDIVNWPANVMASPEEIHDGDLIFVPGGVPPTPASPEPTPTPTSAPVQVVAPPPAPTEPPASAAPPPPPPPVSSSGMIWPYSCQLSRGFTSYHSGIDIDGICNTRATIVAATSGTVIAAVTNSYNGYGFYVDVRSPSGIVTRYAHLSSVHVSVGQSVSQGQGLGIIGCTGRCTGTHLHFEVIVNGVQVDPLGYLP